VRRKLAIIATFVVGLYYFLEFLLPPFVGGGFDNVRMGEPCLVATDGAYRLYYVGIQSRKRASEVLTGIGLAESTDAAAWTKSPKNPLLARSLFSSDDWRGLGTPAIVREPDGSYTMFYVGHGSAVGDWVLRATSRDGVRWRRQGTAFTPVKVEADISKQIDRAKITCLTVLRTETGYEAFFGGTYRRSGQTVQGVSRATSADGLTWKLDEQHNPVLAIEREGGWVYKEFSGLSAVQTDDGLRLYYAGTRTYFLDGGERVVPMTLIGLATSPDGITWTRDAANPIFGPALWRVLKALRSEPHVAAARRRLDAIDSSLPMIGRIGPTAVGAIDLVRALSSDAVWTGAMTAAVGPSETGVPEPPFDTLLVSGVSVARSGDGYIMAYAGAAAAGTNDYRIGLATSADGIAWQRGPAAPALALGQTPRSTILSEGSVYVSRVFIVVGAMALGLGLFGLAKLHGERVVRGSKDMVYSLGFFVSLIFTLVLAFGWGIGESTSAAFGRRLYDVMFSGLLISFGASSMGLLTFYLASSSHRSFKLKNAEAGLMMVAAVLILLSQVPLGQMITSRLPEGVQIQNVAQLLSYAVVIPAMRAIQIGAAVGGLVLATRLWLSIERRRD
jgi:hypothetical protein